MKRNARVIRRKKAQSVAVGDASSQVCQRDTLKELADKINLLENKVLALETPRPIPPGYVPVAPIQIETKNRRAK